MYTVIVVDDEFIIRDGIVNSIPWEEWGFKVIGQAQNGLEALDLIENKKPDVIFTDIKMPEMNGLELIKVVSDKYKDIQVVILSGYSEIEYYKQAITCSVVDYLLKPTCYKDFEEITRKIKNRLDKKNKRVKEYKDLEKQLVESLPYMKQLFLKKLINGYYTDIKLVEEKFNFYDVNLINDRYVVITIEIDNYITLKTKYSEEQNYLFKLSITYLANQLLQQIGNGIFYINNANITGIYSLHKDEEFNIIIELLQRLQREIYNLKKITISAGLSEETTNVLKLNVMYEQANEALKQKIFLGNESITCYNDIKQAENIEYLQCRFEQEKIINYIFYDGQDNLDDLLDTVFDKFKNRLIKRFNYIDKLWYELYFIIARNAIKFDVDLDIIIQNKFIKDISNIENLDMKRKWIMEILLETKKSVKEKKQNNTCKLITEIKRYIDDYYWDNNMSLNMVADKFNKNPAYLSKLFKKETSRNFSDYIINLRIDRAKELLEDVSLKTYEVANKVGYVDPSHFIKVFKKYTGMSTSKYRENHR